MSVRSTETEETASTYESMIPHGATEAARQAIAIVELSGGQLDREDVEISNEAALGLISSEEEIARIIERHSAEAD